MAAVAATAAAAAAGCGAVAAAAGPVAGVPGGVAAARGRFPGRPWSSRSRLRSEKRWQLGRSVTEQDELGVGGLRPGCLAFACGEDQSYTRLLGIEASYNCLGEAGYNSSASEEASLPFSTLHANDGVCIASFKSVLCARPVSLIRTKTAHITSSGKPLTAFSSMESS